MEVSGKAQDGKDGPRAAIWGRQRAAWGTFPRAGRHVPPSALQEPVRGDDSFFLSRHHSRHHAGGKEGHFSAQLALFRFIT